MKEKDILFSLVIILTFAIIGAILSVILSRFIDFGNANSNETFAQESIAVKQPIGAVVFNPLSRGCFGNIKDTVMYKLENLAAFSYKNMPKCNPDLTAEDAIDVASFVTAQPRSRFVPKKG